MAAVFHFRFDLALVKVVHKRTNQVVTESVQVMAILLACLAIDRVSLEVFGELKSQVGLYFFERNPVLAIGENSSSVR